MAGYDFLRSNHFRFGLPFLILMVGSSFGLQVFSQVRYDRQNLNRVVTKTKEVQEALKLKPLKAPEEELVELKQEIDINDWKNKRGPRPWEQGQDDFKERMDKQQKLSEAQWTFKR